MIAITDGESSYSVFTYLCGGLPEDTENAVVGFNAAGDFYTNFQYTSGNDLSCRNRPESDYFNIVYNLNTRKLFENHCMMLSFSLNSLSAEQ